MIRTAALVLVAVILHAFTQPVVRADVSSQLAYSTFYGRFGFDEATDMAVDADGYVYLVGWSESVGFPSTGFDGFLLKLTPDGSQVVYSRSLGGSGFDYAGAVAVDAAGFVYVAGHTTSSDFPMRNAFQPALNGDSDAWVAKLDPEGILVYSSYYGGSSFENGNALALSPSGDVYIAGSTGSLDLPGALGAQQNHGGGFDDGFVVKLRADGSGVDYATYLGGSRGDSAARIVAATDGHAYVVGYTSSADFPVAAALQPAFGGGFNDAFVAKLSPDGRTLVFSTYLGGASGDVGVAAALDAEGALLVAGSTESFNFPTRNAYRSFYQGIWGDVFLSKLAPDGTALVFSTYLGGSNHETGLRLAVDRGGDIHLVGQTDSIDFPLVAAVQEQINGVDGFVMQMSADGQTLVRSTPLGGLELEAAFGLAVAPNGDVWVAGRTDSPDFPIVNGIQPWHSGSGDVFVARLTALASPNSPPVAFAGTDREVVADGCTARVVLDGTLSSDPDGDPLTYLWSGDFGTATGATPTVELLPGTHTLTLTVDDGHGNLASDTVMVTVIATKTSIAASATPDVLDPPNHQMVPVSVSTELTGGCTAGTICTIVDVRSNEPENGLGDGDTSPDWQVTGPLTLLLRAERNPQSINGRIYTVTIECVDASGKRTWTSTTVVVPRS